MPKQTPEASAMGLAILVLLALSLSSSNLGGCSFDPPPPLPPPTPTPATRLVVLLDEMSDPSPARALMLDRVKMWMTANNIRWWHMDPDIVNKDDVPPPELAPYIAAWRSTGKPLPVLCYESSDGVHCEDVSSEAAAVELLTKVFPPDG